MHEEDGELGLWVESPSGMKWKAYGDSRLPGRDDTGKATSTNLEQCREALHQSVQEVHDAHIKKQAILPSQFAAWEHAPIIAKISSNPENHKPLIKVEAGKVYRRINGSHSEEYEVTSGQADWIAFYWDNLSRVSGQIKLAIEKFTGIKLG